MNINIYHYFAESRTQGRINGETVIPETLKLAYDIQQRNLSLFGKVKGWKLGGTNEATRKLFGTSEIYYGPVYADETFHCDPFERVYLKHQQVMGEVEFVFRLSSACSDLSEIQTGKIENYFDAIAIGVELPWTVFDVATHGVNVLVADMCGTGGAILGHVRTHFEQHMSENISVKLSSSERILLTGDTNNLLANPLELLREFLIMVHRHNLSLETHQFVFTGGMTPCVELPRNTILSMHSSLSANPFEFVIG